MEERKSEGQGQPNVLTTEVNLGDVVVLEREEPSAKHPALFYEVIKHNPKSISIRDSQGRRRTYPREIRGVPVTVRVTGPHFSIATRLGVTKEHIRLLATLPPDIKQQLSEGTTLMAGMIDGFIDSLQKQTIIAKSAVFRGHQVLVMT